MKLSVQVIVYPDDDTETASVVREVLSLEGLPVVSNEKSPAGDQVRLKQALARCPQLEATAAHVASFAAMMGQRTGKDQLPAWLDAVTADDLPALHSFVAGLRRDQDAVTNGLSLAYSSGQVEGTVTKIKYLKRQVFGRANFDLLRKRVLAW